MSEKINSYEQELSELYKEKELDQLKLQQISEHILLFQERLEDLIATMRLENNTQSLPSPIMENIENNLRIFGSRILDFDGRLHELEKLVIELYSEYLVKKKDNQIEYFGGKLEPEIDKSHKIEFVDTDTPARDITVHQENLKISEKIRIGQKLLSRIEEKFRDGEITFMEYQSSCEKIQGVLQEISQHQA